MENKKIGILGTGDVGRALGNGFIALGYQVKMGAREAKNAKAAEWAEKAGASASTGTFADAAAFGDIVVLATLWTATEHVLQLAGHDNLNGKIVIDTTNPLDFSVGAPKLSLGHTDSGGEQVQRWVPGAHVVKCWNIVGNPHMFRPDFPGGPPDMFIAGNSDDAKKTVSEIVKSFGWPVADMGGIEASRLLEPFAMLWINYYIRNRTGNHAFKLLKK